MVKNLFKKLGLVCSLAALSVVNSSAQTVINTTYNAGTLRSGVAYTATSPTQITFLSFKVANTNAYPIAVTDLSILHYGAQLFGTTLASGNGGTYTLWINPNANAGIPVTSGNNWSIAGSSSKINTGTTNNVTPVLSGMNAFIPPNSTYSFVISLDDSIAAVTTATGNPTPSSFTVGGVTLTTVGLQWGVMPSSANTGDLAFSGSVTFERARPQKPVVTVTPKAVCYGDSVTLKATADAYITNPIFNWYLNGSLVHTGATYGIGNNVATTIYKVTVTDGAEVSDSADAKVTVNNPKPPYITGKTQYCLNEPFEALDVYGQTVRWYYIASGGSPIPVTPTFNTTTPNSIEYYASQVVDGCESSERTRIFYSAAPKPSKPTVSTPLIYCENDMANQLSASGEDLKWYYDLQGGIPSAIAPTPGTSVQTTEDYYVTQTIDGCESDRAKVEVTVTFRPNGLILPSDNDICAGDSITIGYYGSAFPSSAYRWEFPMYSNRLNGLEQGPITLQFDSAGKYSIFLSVGEGFCYSKRYEEIINVKPIPTANILAKDDLCLGQSDLITVSYYTPTIDDFIWDFNGGEVSHYATDQGPFGVQWNSAGTKIISLKLVDKECSATVTDTVIVHEKPDARIVTSDYTPGEFACASDSIKLSAGTVEPTSSYKWSPANFFRGNSDIPVTYAKVDFTAYIKLRVEDEFGCYASDSMLIETKPCCDLTFPTAFTPDNNGRNDRFHALTNGNFDVKTFKVMNRYGQVIFEGRDIIKGWDGTFNGEPQDMNTYYWFISYVCNGETIEQSGDVVLVR